MFILKKTLISITLIMALMISVVADYYLYQHFFGQNSIGPSINQVYLDFEFDLYRTSNGLLLVSDHVVKKEVISDEQIRYELLIDYKTNPLIANGNQNDVQKYNAALERHVIYYNMIDDQWVKSSI